MRHLGSIVLSIIFAPIIYLLAGIGIFRIGEAGSGSDIVWKNAGIGFGAMIVAGALLAFLLISKLSPLGPMIAGVLFLGAQVYGLFASESSLVNLLGSSVAGNHFAAELPLTGLALLIAVPLIATVVSPRKWRGKDKLPVAAYPAYGTPAAGAPVSSAYGQQAPAYGQQPPAYGQPPAAGQQAPAYGQPPAAPTYAAPTSAAPAYTPAPAYGPTYTTPDAPAPTYAAPDAPAQSSSPPPQTYGSAPAPMTYGTPDAQATPVSSPPPQTYGSAPAPMSYGTPDQQAAPASSPPPQTYGSAPTPMSYGTPEPQAAPVSSPPPQAYGSAPTSAAPAPTYSSQPGYTPPPNYSAPAPGVTYGSPLLPSTPAYPAADETAVVSSNDDEAGRGRPFDEPPANR